MGTASVSSGLTLLAATDGLYLASIPLSSSIWSSSALRLVPPLVLAPFLNVTLAGSDTVVYLASSFSSLALTATSLLAWYSSHSTVARLPCIIVVDLPSRLSLQPTCRSQHCTGMPCFAVTLVRLYREISWSFSIWTSNVCVSMRKLTVTYCFFSPPPALCPLPSVSSSLSSSHQLLKLSTFSARMASSLSNVGLRSRLPIMISAV
mmetsp:Transcript_18737/g.63816  ORF Transcript_18737/g.63816 Transcript_18737/m.63816 type:complete len:206 (-) Transcript_18737:528-1145(-)